MGSDRWLKGTEGDVDVYVDKKDIGLKLKSEDLLQGASPQFRRFIVNPKNDPLTYSGSAMYLPEHRRLHILGIDPTTVEDGDWTVARNQMSPGVVRKTLKAILQIFPEAETVSGGRVTGMRAINPDNPNRVQVFRLGSLAERRRLRGGLMGMLGALALSRLMNRGFREEGGQ